MTSRQIKSVNRTSRNWKTTAIDNIIRNIITPSDKVLDFGAGKNAVQALRLQNEGYNVTAHDFGDNFNPVIHDKLALSRQYDIVYASNVINVQPSFKTLNETLLQMKSRTKKYGVLIVNYPKDPRVLKLSTNDMEKVLLKIFPIVKRNNRTKNIIWFCLQSESNRRF